MAASPDEGAESALPAEVASVATGALKVAVDSQDLAPNARWSLSGAKPGNGAPQLMDGDVRHADAGSCYAGSQRQLACFAAQLETFWQSDGTAPHTVTLRFDVRTSMSELAFYVDHGLDESYTPQEVCCAETLVKRTPLHAATRSAGDCQARATAHSPFYTPHCDSQQAFWVCATRGLHARTFHTGCSQRPLRSWVRVKLGNPEAEGQNAFLRTFVLQLAVTKLHQNGRDTRLRQVKVLGPRMSAEGTLAHSGGGAATADKLSGTMFTIR